MKIRANSELGLMPRKKIINEIVKIFSDMNMKRNIEYPSIDTESGHVFNSHAELVSAFDQYCNFVFSDKCRYYLPLESVKQLTEKICLDNFTPKILSKIPDGERFTYLLGELEFYSAFKQDGIFHMCCVWFEKKDDGLYYMQYMTHHMNTNTGYSSKDHDKNDGLHQFKIQRFLQFIVFVELADIRIEKLKPGTKLKQNNEKYINVCNNEIAIIVDSKWNIHGVRTDGFNVSGHLRLQPCGQNNEDRKLIFIDQYQKYGYTRRAGKERAGLI